jgi:hypothetical protein
MSGVVEPDHAEAATALVDRIVQAGHVLKLDEDGAVDEFVCDAGYHNGPGCSVCGESWCQHCASPRVETCDGGAWRAAYEARERVRDAAPEPLEALKELLWEDSDKSDAARIITRLRAAAAIAKATGAS